MRSLVVHDSTVSHVVTDLNGKFLEFDNSYCRLLKREPSELKHLTLQQISHIDDLSLNLKLLHRLVSNGQPFVIQKRYVHPDGSTVWVENHVSRLTSPIGNAVRLCATSFPLFDAPSWEASRRRHLTLYTETCALLDRSRNLRARLRRVFGWDRSGD
ncbi:PAS domain-containing protein [Belnapia sp. F-4-1]|uniref:PAS domain-containing protein n=1 Tax=Belnapia sp. F-4-1 TaxID=1545443 RepID=UPI0009DF4F45